MGPDASPEGHHEPLSGRVLYIEDAEVNFAVVQAMLARHPQVELRHAPNGLTGVRMAQEQHPDFVLLDMHLPDISGVEVVRRLSEDIAAHRYRVTLLTGSKFTIDVIKAMSLGAFEYLLKPVDLDRLDAAVRRGLAVSRAERERF